MAHVELGVYRGLGSSGLGCCRMKVQRRGERRGPTRESTTCSSLGTAPTLHQFNLGLSVHTILQILSKSTDRDATLLQVES